MLDAGKLENRLPFRCRENHDKIVDQCSLLNRTSRVLPLLALNPVTLPEASLRAGLLVRHAHCRMLAVLTQCQSLHGSACLAMKRYPRVDAFERAQLVAPGICTKAGRIEFRRIKRRGDRGLRATVR